jgi:hypothetical protein
MYRFNVLECYLFYVTFSTTKDRFRRSFLARPQIPTLYGSYFIMYVVDKANTIGNDFT